MERSTKIRERIDQLVLVRWIRWLFIMLLSIPIKIYQWIISPVLPKTCRYHPTCSEYALESLRIHGPVIGLLLGTKRILSCNPWGGHGYDPVPSKGASFYSMFKPGKK